MKDTLFNISLAFIKALAVTIFVVSLLVIIAEDSNAYEVGNVGPAGGIVISTINVDHGTEAAKEDYLAMGIGGDAGSWDRDTYEYLNDLARSYKFKYKGITYDGWRSPTLSELNVLYSLTQGQTFEDATYWSSTVLNTGRTTSIDFITGNLVKGDTGDLNRMRYVRDF